MAGIKSIKTLKQILLHLNDNISYKKSLEVFAKAVVYGGADLAGAGTGAGGTGGVGAGTGAGAGAGSSALPVACSVFTIAGTREEPFRLTARRIFKSVQRELVEHHLSSREDELGLSQKGAAGAGASLEASSAAAEVQANGAAPPATSASTAAAAAAVSRCGLERSHSLPAAKPAPLATATSLPLPKNKSNDKDKNIGDSGSSSSSSSGSSNGPRRSESGPLLTTPQRAVSVRKEAKKHPQVAQHVHTETCKYAGHMSFVDQRNTYVSNYYKDAVTGFLTPHSSTKGGKITSVN
jgi:hypothetical protein